MLVLTKARSVEIALLGTLWARLSDRGPRIRLLFGGLITRVIEGIDFNASGFQRNLCMIANEAAD